MCAVLGFDGLAAVPSLLAAALAAASSLAASRSAPAPVPPPCAPTNLCLPRRPLREYDRWAFGIHLSGSGLDGRSALYLPSSSSFAKYASLFLARRRSAASLFFFFSWLCFPSPSAAPPGFLPMALAPLPRRGVSLPSSSSPSGRTDDSPPSCSEDASSSASAGSTYDRACASLAVSSRRSSSERSSVPSADLSTVMASPYRPDLMKWADLILAESASPPPDPPPPADGEEESSSIISSTLSSRPA
mmetsp:Transcript_24130/g.52541  ORF Transcript_24130/g.52541 Transcript_24130/m.52541 type:complete len:246 (+) Transcript_24130:187-924(+)